MSIHDVMRETFGFAALRPGQQQVIEHLMAGRSAAAIFPTGGGKSLCYQLPALLLPGVTVVVSPLIALMKDQIDALQKNGVQAARLDSSLSLDQYRDVVSALHSGVLKILYVSPERFNNERFRETLRTIRISLFAVDEAHCISEWGHSFRPDYLKLAGFAREFAAESILALTATATPPVLIDICQGFDIDKECAITTGFYRSNLKILTQVVDAATRDQILLESLQSADTGATIVYVTLQKTANQVASQLAAAGLPAKAYHAGLKTPDREAIQEWFMAADNAVVVATIAFGMGVDKSNIRAVYHYNLPKSLENYSQEIGRAGRDGKKAVCHALVCTDDLNTLENFVYGDTPEESAICSLLTELFSLGAHFDVSLYTLSNDHDIRSLVLRTLLTYLELDGYLLSGTPFFAQYQFRPSKTSKEILATLAGDRRAFVSDILQRSVKASTWFHIDVDQVAGDLNTTRGRVVQELDWMSDQHFLQLKVSGVRNRYTKLQTPDSVAILAREVYQRFLHREESEIGRLRHVLDWIALDDCLTNALTHHFGEPRSEPCGHCQHCLGGKTNLPPRQSSPIPEDVWQKAVALRSNTPETLDSPRLFTRFLCGISSPRLSKARLSRHPLFGSLQAVPFSVVLKRSTGAGEPTTSGPPIAGPSYGPQ